MPEGYLIHGNRKYRLGKEFCLIGRDLNCNIYFQDELLSRRHCFVVYNGERYLIIDFNSSNGVSVNNKRIDFQYLEDGDFISMGTQEFTFKIEESEEDKAPKAPVLLDTDESGVERFEKSMREDTLNLLKSQALDRNDAYNRLLILYKVSRVIASVRNIDDLMNRIVDLALEVINADRGLIMLYDEKEGALVSKVSRTRHKESLESGLRNISQSIARYTFEKAKPILTQDALIDPRFQSSGSIQLFNIRSALCCPLSSKNNVLGVIYVDNRIQSHSFAESDLKLLEAFSDQVAIAIDNTKLYEDLKDSLLRLKKQQEALIQNEKLAAMGQLSAGVAHEIRNPLTAISGYVQLYFAKNKEDAPFFKKMKVIEQALQQINRIVEGLLGFSRKSETTLEKTTCEKIIEDTLVIAEHSLSRYSSVKIERKFGQNVPTVHVDKRQIQQVFLNFMMNAAQAMPEGGSLTILTRCVADKNDPTRRFVETIFRDTGIGIAKEKFDSLFQPFYTSGKEGGTGLGLSISKSIVEKHQGCIYFESEVGKGTTFFIRLPAAP